jgi:rsbT co-antagonist protein RsbR
MNQQGKTKESVEIPRDRLERMIEVMASITTGEYDVRLEIDDSREDDFTPVEYSVNFLTEQLRFERRQKLELIEQQRRSIEELSTPIIKIWDQVLVLPLIGAIDTRRSQRLTESLLTDIAATMTRMAILDITGVPAVDSAVANHLIKTVSAVRLLGAECVITGIRPDVAQTIVHLGVDLSQIETLANLSEGLKWAFKRIEQSGADGSKPKNQTHPAGKP